MARPKGTKNGTRAITPKACERCGTVRYYSKPSLAKSRRFCSHKCSRATQITTCATCGNTFEQQAASAVRYCSRECAGEGRSRCPERDVLFDMYVTRRLSTRTIGDHFGVPKITVRRWLNKRSIEVRPTGRGLAYHGRPVPTREQLYALVHLEHRSYPEIGQMFGIDGTAVRWWLDKYGIERPTPLYTRRRGVIPELPDVDTLTRLYLTEQHSLRQIGRIYDVGEGQISSLCRKYGIPVRADGWDSKRIKCADGHVVRSTYEQRVCDWLSRHSIAHTYEPILPFDRRCKGDFLAGECFIEIWGVTHNPEYKERQRRKQSQYRSHSLCLLNLSHYMFTAQKDSWHKKLAKQFLSPVVHPETSVATLF